MAQVAQWLSSQGVPVRDARVIVPVGAVLPLARRAWSAVSPGWMPQIDTIAGWAQQLAWQADAGGQAGGANEGSGEFPPMSLHPVADQMQLRAAWARQGWASAWQRRDPRGYDHGLAKVVAMAHAVLRRLQAVAPEAREAWVAQAMADWAQRTPAMSASATGSVPPGAREHLLQQWAVSWAGHVAAQGLSGDPLFAQRPAAAVLVVAGDTVAAGTEAHWSMSLLAHWQAQGLPVLRVHAQPQRPLMPHGDPAEAGAAIPQPPELVRVLDAEDEAQQACAVVLQAVQAQRDRAQVGHDARPVALLALDRSVIRRMRAVLEGAGVRLADETGWRLSTTRAASALTRLLRAARPQASTEDWLDWLKSGWLPEGLPPEHGGGALGAATTLLETHCRRHQILQAWSLQDDRQLPDEAQPLCRWVTEVLQPLHERWSSRGGTLALWLDALSASLQRCGAWAAWSQDEAGQAAWRAVHGLGAEDQDAATPSGVSPRAWSGLAHKARMDGHRFGRWLGDVLEATVFRPPAPPQPDVVITTLARATLRPFAALVMPGAHLGQLGALEPVDPWLGGAWGHCMDLSSPTSRRAMQWEAWALLMNQPGMTCLLRMGQGSEPLSPSPWLAQWQEASGVPWRERSEVRAHQALTPEPVCLPRPVVPPDLLPARWNATAYDTMRDCPYRYFAVHVLGLRAQDELEEGVDHADHGTWLHEVLRRFHQQRDAWPQGLGPEDALALWLQCAREVAAEHGLDQEATRPYFAPYLADAPRLAQAYLHWLAGHEADGWAVRWMERSLSATELGSADAPLTLHGQIDRLDECRTRSAATTDGGGQAAGPTLRRMLIDYKTGNLQRLKGKVRTPDEDTQLAFYATLAPMAAGWDATAGELSAAYLHIHRDAVTLVPHDDVADTAVRLTQAMGIDWQRLQRGAALPALGEGPACAHCDHQGLCRKAHWSPADPEVTPDLTAQGEAS